MQKLIKASLLLLILSVLQTKAFAAINCRFKSETVTGVESIQISEEALFINGTLEIPLEKTKIRCGAHGKRDRYEGMENGLHVIVKSCSPDSKLEGHLIDAKQQEAAAIECE